MGTCCSNETNKSEPFSDEMEMLKKIDKSEPFRQFNGVLASKLHGIVDGDTIHAIVIYQGKDWHVKIRIAGIDTPEKDTPETRKKAEQATEEVYRFFGLDDLLAKYIEEKKIKTTTRINMTEKRRLIFSKKNVLFYTDFGQTKNISDGDCRGRMLGSVLYKGKDLGKVLLDKGLANVYHGGTKDTSNFMSEDI